eukprot:scaffold5723_cov150-Skeletonema_dohrnii-CCMP3373.AAC.8
MLNCLLYTSKSFLLKSSHLHDGRVHPTEAALFAARSFYVALATDACNCGYTSQTARDAAR